MLFGAKTDIGKIREVNEDSYGIKGDLFVIADGMGGHRAGEVASTIAIETLLDWHPRSFTKPGLQRILRKANDNILAEVAKQPEFAGMGTTIAVMALEIPQALIAHVGDSRIYRYTAEGKLLCLTNDHTFVAELVKNGELGEVEAKHHPQRNMLTRSLGSQSYVTAEIEVINIEAGDKFLICSDGLTGTVNEETIGRVLGSAESPQAQADQLITLANQAGGKDNVTVIVIVP